MKSVYRVAKDFWQLLPAKLTQKLRHVPLVGPAVNRVSATLIGRASHDEIYDARYYDYVDRLAAEAAPTMAASLLEMFAPATVVDVGCGTGAFLAEMQRRGARVHGLEYSDAGVARTRAKGLGVSQFDLGSDVRPDLPHAQFELVTSFEVAEHLPAQLADRYLDTLVSLGRRVVMTAAVPGQGGLNHVNEQPNEYWIEHFARRGFRHQPALTRQLRERWSAGMREQKWYADNVLVFFRVDGEAR